MTRNKSSESILATAEQCGATVYRHRTSAHAPAVAFGDEAWSKFAATIAQPAPAGSPQWPPVAQIAKWALQAIEAGARAPAVINVEAIKEHLRRLAASAPAPSQPTPPDSPSTYRTQPAESLCGIALRQLGNESRWVEISELNADRFPGMLGPDYYPVGTVLRMPACRDEPAQPVHDKRSERRAGNDR